MPIGLVLADDHPIVLDGLEKVLSQERDVKVLARCRDGEETLSAVRKHRPDVLILDIRMPGKDGLAVLRDMKKEQLATRVVVLTAALDDDTVLEAIRLGVRGVVLKEMAPALLVQCMRKVHSGDQWVEKRSFGRALELMLKREEAGRQMAGLLTARELEIVRAIARGLSNREIGERLCISEGTVKIHLHHIYEKLHVEGRLALMRYTQDRGLV